MTQIDIKTGTLYLEDNSLPLFLEQENANPISKTSIVDGLPFNATPLYKNQKLISIHLIITDVYLKENYKPQNDIDFRDYLTPYIDYCKSKTEELLNSLTNTTKRKFEWGKISVSVDQKAPLIFAEINYY